MNANHYYRLFGLAVASEIDLGDIAPGSPGLPPDIRITRGPLPAGLPTDEGLHPVEGGSLLCIPEAGRFLALGGAQLQVEPGPDSPERNVRLFLLGSAMGLLLHQRGLLPLHANALELDGQAVAFMGPSGAGKSTLAAWYAGEGHRIIADDVCVVEAAADGRALVQPGLPRVRLWREAVEKLGGRADDYSRSFEGDPDYDKFDVPIGEDSQTTGGVPLRAICLLEGAEALSVRRLQGVEAMEALFANTYRGDFLTVTGTDRLHWQSCVDLLRRVPILRVERPWGLERFDRTAEAVLAEVRRLSD